MKITYGTSLLPSPTAGDSQVRTADDTSHFCKTDGVWTQMGGASQAVLEFDTFTLAIHDSTNWTRSNWPGLVQRQAANVHIDFSNYTGSFWRIIERSDSTEAVVDSWDQLTFASIADIYTFIRNNCTESVSVPGTPENNIIGTVYEIIDSSVQSVNRIYGLNTFLATLKGRKRYQSSTAFVLEGSYCGWSSMGSWVDALNAYATNWLNPAATWSPGDERIVWFSRNNKKMYGLPAENQQMGLTSTSTRHAWDWGSSGIVPVPPGSTYQISNPGGATMIYCVLNVAGGGTAWAFLDRTELRAITSYIHDPNYSMLALYQVYNTADSNHRAVLCKPVGIDRVSIPWFDPALYDLFAIYNRKNQTPVIKPCSISFQDVVANKAWVEKPQWIPPFTMGTKSSVRMVGTQQMTTRFFLRDKTTNRISPPSKAGIICAQRQKDAMFKYEVR